MLSMKAGIVVDNSVPFPDTEFCVIELMNTVKSELLCVFNANDKLFALNSEASYPPSVKLAKTPR